MMNNMKFAVIKTGGKQYKVAEKSKVKIEKLKVNEGDKFDFDQVLLIADGDKVEVGQPVLNKKVSAKVLSQGRGAKVMVVKYKPKTRYHKAAGHRQLFTEVQIEKIG